jgi:hypothetical protein
MSGHNKKSEPALPIHRSEVAKIKAAKAEKESKKDKKR